MQTLEVQGKTWQVVCDDYESDGESINTLYVFREKEGLRFFVKYPKKHVQMDTVLFYVFKFIDKYAKTNPQVIKNYKAETGDLHLSVEFDEHEEHYLVNVIFQPK